MSNTSQAFAENYTTALQDYLAGAGEIALGRAYELGRQALEFESCVIIVAGAHHKALQAIAPKNSTDEINAPIISKAGEFFSECLSPFEMAQRGFQESIASLRDLNEALQQQKRDLHLLLS